METIERNIRTALEDIAWESEQDPNAEEERQEEREGLERDLLTLMFEEKP